MAKYNTSETGLKKENKMDIVAFESSNDEKSSRSQMLAMAKYNTSEFALPNLNSTDNNETPTMDSPLNEIESTNRVTILKSLKGKAKAYSDGFIYNLLAK